MFSTIYMQQLAAIHKIDIGIWGVLADLKLVQIDFEAESFLSLFLNPD